MHARPLQPTDDDRIRALFAATLVMGRPYDGSLDGFEAYRSLCLDWYLQHGRLDAAVVDGPDGSLLGYCLVCVDEASAATWQRHTARRLARTLTRDVFRGDLGRGSVRFYRSRVRDAGVLARRHRRPVAPVHAHLNVDRRARTGAAAKHLVRHVDDRCRRAGFGAWYGEVNAFAGRRQAGLQRMGLEVVRRDVNHTLTRLCGRPVDRLTVLRRVPDLVVVPDLRARAVVVVDRSDPRCALDRSGGTIRP